MRVTRAVVTNFGSFKHLDFDFSTPGLSLIYGPTGSGKSTISNIIPWVLYGVTSKNGSVDDIRSWTSEGEVTVGTLEVLTSTGIIIVNRIRGSAKQNDLSWTEDLKQGVGTIRRGKDVTETQRLLEKKLGISSDLYHTGGLYTEFSQTGTFFTGKAKDRRSLLEQVASLHFPVTLALNLSLSKKQTQKEFVALNADLENKLARIDECKRVLKDVDSRQEEWDQKQASKKITTLSRMTQYHENTLDVIATYLKEIVELSSIPAPQKCPTCGKQNADHNKLRVSYLKKELQTLETAANPYATALESLKNETNPFVDQKTLMSSKLDLLCTGMSTTSSSMKKSTKLIHDLTLLQDLTDELKALLLVRSITEAQDMTNRYLETHFDSELRVTLNLEGSDDLNVIISKNGYEANFRQLSKGQRTLLKLCFSLSIMQIASNRASVHFDTLFLDEALDGCDSALKIKAFSLLQSLNIDFRSIFIVDHEPGFQNLFEQKYRVELSADASKVYAET